MNKMFWFRFYSDFRGDPKIKRLPIIQRYAFIILLCLASESDIRGVITGFDDEDLAFELEMQLEDWQTLKAKFKAKGFINFTQTEIFICNWDKRQYEKPSDLPEATKERKRLQRSRDKLLRKQNVTPVTPLSRDVTYFCHADTDTDTDTDTESFFLRAQEKETKLDCIVENIHFEQKKEILNFEDNQDRTPPIASRPPKFIDPYVKAMEVRQRKPEIDKMTNDVDFLRFLIPILKRFDCYKNSCDASDSKKWVRVSLEAKNDKCDSRWDEVRDRYQDFLESQTQRQHQISTEPEHELITYAIPSFVKDFVAANLARKSL